MKKVIVYGTLKKGGRLHGYMGDSKFIVDVMVTGYKMYDTKSGFPFIVRGDDEKYMLETHLLSMGKKYMVLSLKK